jgi:hypothetical protein
MDHPYSHFISKKGPQNIPNRLTGPQAWKFMLADISVFAAPINTYVYHVSKKTLSWNI